MIIDTAQNVSFSGDITVSGAMDVTGIATTTDLRVITLASVKELAVSDTSTLTGPVFLGSYLQLTAAGDNHVYFTSSSGNYMMWDSVNSRFVLSDNLMANGTISSTGYIAASTSVRSRLFCDINGNNCFDPSISGWPSGGATGTLATQVLLTAATTDGNFASGGKVGYQAATDMCQTEYAGSHFCFTGEILHIIAAEDISGFASTAWISEGPPGYTANSNDCNGYTSSDNTKLGAFWVFDANGGGMGWLTNCAVVKSVSCCR